MNSARLVLFGRGLGGVPMCNLAAWNVTSLLDNRVNFMVKVIIFVGSYDVVEGFEMYALEEDLICS